MIPKLPQHDPKKYKLDQTMIPKVFQDESKVKPKSVQHESKLIPKPGPGRSDKGRKRVGLFLKDSSVSHCVLAGYLFSSLDLVQSS